MSKFAKGATAVRRTPQALRVGLVCVALSGLASASQAGVMDFLFGAKKAPDASQPVSPKRRTWPIGEFTEIKLVAAEPGAAPNSQPIDLSAETLRSLLAAVQMPVPGGSDEPLFGADELNELTGPMHEAFTVAGPGDDMLLVSSARRSSGIFSNPLAMTARLFVQGGMLNLIVHDARLEYYSNYRGMGKAPVFVYGSRTQASPVQIMRAGAVSRRSDWLQIPLQPMADAAPSRAMPAPAPMATPMQAPMQTPIVPAAREAAPAAVPAPATTPRDAAFYDAQEQRLTALKRLHDRGLITDDEYQQKRREVLQGL